MAPPLGMAAGMVAKVSEKPRKIRAESVRAADANGYPFASAALIDFVH